MTKRLLNFIHIPKTAGTTFISILKNNFAAKRILQIDGLDPERTRVELERGKPTNHYTLLMGHWSIGFERFFPNRKIVRIVFLRDPLEHFLSTYSYIRRTPVHLQHEVANRLSLEEFLKLRQEMKLDNLQVRHMAGIPTNMVAGTVDLSDSGDEVLRRAMRELDACHYVFLTEKFDDALQILKDDKILRRTVYTRKNVSRGEAERKQPVTKDVVRAILDANRFDVALYEHAKAAYQERARLHAAVS